MNRIYSLSLILLVLFLSVCSKGIIILPPIEEPNRPPVDIVMIATPTDLDNVRSNLGGHYKLIADIDLTGCVLQDSPSGWQPIGEVASPFTGNFDGNGHTITGVRINRDTQLYSGLFGYVLNCTIKNLGIETDMEGIRGGSSVGGLVGYVGSYSNISNCYTNGFVTCNRLQIGNTSFNCNVGGIAGYVARGASLSNCYSGAEVTGFGQFIGGLVGFCAGDIENCYARGSVSGVTTNGNGVGGLVGFLSSGITKNCVALNQSVRGNFAVGRIVGHFEGNGLLNNLAINSMEVIMENVAKSISDNRNDKDGASKFITVLKQQATYESMGWNFYDVWAIDEKTDGYPILRKP